MKKVIRQGSAIVESAIIIPVLVIAMWIFICVSIVLMDWSNATFVVSDELRMQAIKSAFVKEPFSGPVLIKSRIERESIMLDNVKIGQYEYLHKSCGIDDLIAITVEADFSRNNPLNLLSETHLRQRILCRGFTGAINNNEVYDAGNDNTKVYIFPGWGTKYHNKDCRILKDNPMRVVLNRRIKSKYKCCPYSKKMHPKLGNCVMIFPNAGKDFHVPGCPHIGKYYEEILKTEARRQGYRPCQICGCS